MSAVCGLRFTDFNGLPFPASKDFNSYQLLQTKRLNSHVMCVFMFYSLLLIINNISEGSG